MSLVSLSRHTLSQLKFIVPGALCTWYLDSHHAFWRLVTSARGWTHTTALAALILAALTVSLFLYVLFMPAIRGEQPNFRHWRQSGVLSSVIPTLTASIVSGWSLLVYTLGHHSLLGYFEGVIAASGLYALGFGILGLIPAPKVYRRA